LLTSNNFAKLPGINELVKKFYAVFLYDEVNSTNEYANRILTEPMQECAVTAGGVLIPLNPAFFMLFTRNDAKRGQTYPLPEAVEDRIALQDRLSPPTEKEALAGLSNDAVLAYQERALSRVEPIIDVDQLLKVREYILHNIKVTPAMDEYIMKLVSGCMNQWYLVKKLGVERILLPNGEELDLNKEKVILGSWEEHTAPLRTQIALKEIAKTAAYFAGKQMATPQILKRFFNRAMEHHIRVEVQADRKVRTGIEGSSLAAAIADEVIDTVDMPR